MRKAAEVGHLPGAVFMDGGYCFALSACESRSGFARRESGIEPLRHWQAEIRQPRALRFGLADFVSLHPRRKSWATLLGNASTRSSRDETDAAACGSDMAGGS